MSSNKKPLAIIAGVGSGTGAAVARRFAAKYTTILLSRNLERLAPMESQIKERGGDVRSVCCDLSKPESVDGAFAQIKQAYPDVPCAAAVFNATGNFLMKGILDVKVEDLDAAYAVTMRGALLFAQATLPLLLKHADLSSNVNAEQQHHLSPTLIFTGATASLRGSAMFSCFAAPKFALRGLAQSIAREFAPQGVHVCHAVIDGPIDVPALSMYLKDKSETQKIDPDGIAEAYWSLHCQSRRAWTHEIDIRAMDEKW